jgi:hypothetical protein
MPYQIFSRSSHVGGHATPDPHPRRVRVVDTIEEAREVCAERNDNRSTLERVDGFHYEFAELSWYEAAFGNSRPRT